MPSLNTVYGLVLMFGSAGGGGGGGGGGYSKVGSARKGLLFQTGGI